MDKEDYVSLEVARKLYQKGFEIKGSYLWVSGVLCPTLYETQKRLRVHHKILVTPYYIGRKEYTYHINYMDVKNYYCNNNKAHSSYELAFNEGILEALKLI